MDHCLPELTSLGSSSRQYFEYADQNLEHGFAWNICDLKIQLFRRPIVSWFWLCRRHIYCNVHKCMLVQRSYNLANFVTWNHVLYPPLFVNNSYCTSSDVKHVLHGLRYYKLFRVLVDSDKHMGFCPHKHAGLG